MNAIISYTPPRTQAKLTLLSGSVPERSRHWRRNVLRAVRLLACFICLGDTCAALAADPNCYWVNSVTVESWSSCSEDATPGTLTADGQSTATATCYPGARSLVRVLSVVWDFEGDSRGCSIQQDPVEIKKAKITAGKKNGPVIVRSTAELSIWCTNQGFFTETVVATANLLLSGAADEGGCSACGGAAGSSPDDSDLLHRAKPGTMTILNNNGPDFSLNLGRYDARQHSGMISFTTTVPATASRALLTLPYVREQVHRVPATGTMEQVKMPEGLAIINQVSTYKFEMAVYYNSDVTGPNQNGYYSPNQNTTPFVTWAVENPSGNTSLLRISKDQQTQYDYAYDSGTSTWALTDAGNLRTVTTCKTTDAQQIIHSTREVKSGANVLQRTYTKSQTLNGKELPLLIQEGVEPALLMTTNTYYSSGANAGLLQRVDRSDGTWEYYDYDAEGRVASKYEPYLNSARPVGQNPPSASTCKLTTYAYSLATGTDDTYDAGVQMDTTPRKTSVQLLGHEVQRTYTAYTFVTDSGRNYLQQVETRRCRNPHGSTTWSDTDNLKTATWYFSDPAIPEQLARPQATLNENGTVMVYDYTLDPSGTGTQTQWQGQPDANYSGYNPPTGVLQGTKTVTSYDELGLVQERTVTAIQGGLQDGVVLAQETYNYKQAPGFTVYMDPLRRNHDVTDLAGRTTKYRYSCCFLDYIIDADQVKTYYDYDTLGRLLGTRRVVQTSPSETWINNYNVLDAADRMLAQCRVGTDGGAAVFQAQSLYDALGRAVRQTNALGGVTIITNVLVNEQRYTTNTAPDNGVRGEVYYRDGRLEKVFGTRAFPVRYLYDIAQDGTVWREYQKEIKLKSDGTDSDQWQKTWYDGVGNGCRTEYSVAGASQAPYEETSYNSLGQMWKQRDADNVVTLYTYDVEGRQQYTIKAVSTTTHDLSSYAALVTALPTISSQNSPDRVTSQTYEVAQRGAVWVTTRHSLVWKDGQGTGTEVATDETSADGLQRWSTLHNGAQAITTLTTATVADATGHRTETTTLPQGGLVKQFQYGRLVSQTSVDSGGAQVTQTSYIYNSHGLLYQQIDARCGPTTYVYNNGDQVTYTTTPDTGGGAQVTTTFYNHLGQLTGQRYPDATTVTNFYSPAGLLTKTYGSRIYPVEYTYDIQGRMATMKTWQSFAANGGTATTTWNYDSYRGWLKSKDYPDKGTGNPPAVGTGGPQYAYTPGGRLLTRTWLRRGTDGNNGIVTSYTYGFDQTDTKHGDLVGVAYYNDPASTPSISYSYNRLGQRSQVVQNFQNPQNSITTSLAYNDANQLLSESYDNGLLDSLSVNSTYNNILQRTALSLSGISGTYSVSYGYDTAGRLQAANSGVNGAVYTYLANSPLVSQIAFTNSGTTRMTTTKQYDFLNRLTSVQTLNAQQSTISSYNYHLNAANERIRSTLADGSHWLYTYDSLGQVTSGKRFWQDGTPVAGQQYEYGFDDVGNRKSASMGGDANGGPLRQARYDTPSAPNRLNQYVQRDVPAKVDIMGIANPTASVTVNNNPAYRKGEYFDYALSTPNTASLWYNTVTVHSSYGAGQDSSGQLFVPKSPEQFAYDLDGNLTNDGHWAYTWDAENRLIRMTNNATTGPKQGLAFEYDWSSRRIHKQVWSQAAAPTNNVKFLYDGWNLLAELNTTNNGIIRAFLWGTDLSGTPQGAGGVGGLLEVSYIGAQTTNSFVAFDGNGNVAALADAASTSILAQYEFGPFGEVVRATGPMAKANPFRFSTKYQDDETELLYYGYRYYNASTGRWISRDPLNEQVGANLQGFVGNNGINSVDVLGKQLCGYGCMPKDCDGVIDCPTKPSMPCALWRGFYSWQLRINPNTPPRRRWDDTEWYNLNRPNSVAAAQQYFKEQIEKQTQLCSLYYTLPLNRIGDYVVGPQKGGRVRQSEWELGDPEQSNAEAMFWIGYYSFRMTSFTKTRWDCCRVRYEATITLIDTYGIQEQHGGSITPILRTVVGPGREVSCGDWKVSGWLSCCAGVMVPPPPYRP